MSDELNSQLSAFIDDELSPEESELFVRRVCRDETLRHTAACYGIIGDALRGETAVTAPSQFATGVMMAVEGQSVPVVSTPAVPVERSMRNWGVAAAASVALAAVALMTLPNQSPDGPDTIVADSTNPVPAERLAVVESPDPASPQPLMVADNIPLNPANEAFRQDVAQSFLGVDNDYNVPIIIPATAENRARLNNLLLQHLSSSGATRQPIGFRNVGVETQTEAKR